MSDIEMHISVVIPTYNRERWIRCAIDSVLAQTYSNYEIIVVDDGSSDNTRQVIQEYGNRVRYFYQTNKGVSAARNLGIREAKGEWIAFLDSDDEWLPSKLELQMNLAVNNPKIAMVATNSYVEDLKDRNKTLTFLEIKPKLFNSEESICLDNPLIAIITMSFFSTTLLIKRENILRAGLFDETMTLSEDTDLFCRVAIGTSLGVLSRPLVRVISRGEGDISLSASQEVDPRRALVSAIVTYQKLLQSFSLNSIEMSFVKKRLSGVRFYLGAEEYKRKQRKLGAKLIFQSIKDSYSLTSMIRATLFFIVGYANIMRIQKMQSGEITYKRSDV